MLIFRIQMWLKKYTEVQKMASSILFFQWHVYEFLKKGANIGSLFSSSLPFFFSLSLATNPPIIAITELPLETGIYRQPRNCFKFV